MSKLGCVFGAIIYFPSKRIGNKRVFSTLSHILTFNSFVLSPSYAETLALPPATLAEIVKKNRMTTKTILTLVGLKNFLIVNFLVSYINHYRLTFIIP